MQGEGLVIPSPLFHHPLMAEEITGGLVDFKRWLISVFQEDINILYWIRSCIPVLYKKLEMVFLKFVFLKM
jgi:hypothetical protein